MNITKNNWMTTSLDKRTASNLCDFSITINPHPFEIDSFENNTIRVAKELSEKYDNIHLLYGGGSDSEYILKTFLDNNLPITPVLVVNQFNWYEMELAVNFFKKRNIKPLIYKYEKDETVAIALKLCYTTGYYSFVGAFLIDVCQKINAIGGNVLTGAGDSIQIDSNNNPIFELTEWDFYINYIGNNIGSFFTYDIGIQYSMLNDFKIVGDYQKSKCELYKLDYRDKRYWHRDFYTIFNIMKLNINKFMVSTSAENYKNILLGNTSTTIT